MKGMKGKLLKKLKSIKPIANLKQDRILQMKSLDGYVNFLPKISTFNISNPFVSRENESNKILQSCEENQQEENQPEIIEVSELMRDLEEEDQEMDLNDGYNNKENIGPFLPNSNSKPKSDAPLKEKTESKQSGVLKEKRSDGDRKRKSPFSETNISSFRKPDLDSSTLFDPNLLEAFEQAVKEHARMTEEYRINTIEEEPLLLIEEEENEIEIENPLLLFEEKCPPGGDGAVVFYTTSLRGIRKTFEDCEKVRFLLQSFKVLYLERDISMDKGYRDELWSILDGKILPPRLFVKGRYIGGAEEVVSLHEQGKLRQILEGVPVDLFDGPCDACGGVRFILCFKCHGSHKVMEQNGEMNQCSVCNENGLVVCPYCG